MSIFNVDSQVLTVDATNNRLGIGTHSPGQAFRVLNSVPFNFKTPASLGPSHHYSDCHSFQLIRFLALIGLPIQGEYYFDFNHYVGMKRVA